MCPPMFISDNIVAILKLERSMPALSIAKVPMPCVIFSPERSSAVKRVMGTVMAVPQL